MALSWFRNAKVKSAYQGHHGDFCYCYIKGSQICGKRAWHGAVDYLYKPLDPYITSAKVDSFVHLARTQAEIKQKNEELQNFAIVVKNSADIICVG
jgi:response regulator RpfG family c-di-GMP phosphodiesterase